MPPKGETVAGVRRYFQNAVSSENARGNSPFAASLRNSACDGFRTCSQFSLSRSGLGLTRGLTPRPVHVSVELALIDTELRTRLRPEPHGRQIARRDPQRTCFVERLSRSAT